MRRFRTFKTMKNLLIRLSDNILSKSQMKNVRGGDDYGGEGWCYHYFCECGDNVFSNVGNYQQYQSDCQANCSAGDPISCNFGKSNWC